MTQEHWLSQQDSPTPMTILPPSSSLSPTPPPSIPIASTSQTPNINERPRRQKKCYKCHKYFHNKRHCPKYHCQNCRQTQPGHLTCECQKEPTPEPQDFDQDYDYDPDRNLNGEQ